MSVLPLTSEGFRSFARVELDPRDSRACTCIVSCCENVAHTFVLGETRITDPSKHHVDEGIV
jgi:hypothetical protein